MSPLPLCGNQTVFHKQHTGQSPLCVPLMVRLMRERNFVARNNPDKVLRETREGRFDNQSKHNSIELVDNGATTVLNFLLYQSLVWGGVRLQFADESFGFYFIVKEE